MIVGVVPMVSREIPPIISDFGNLLNPRLSENVLRGASQMGNCFSDLEDARDDDRDEPKSGRAGGAVGGTPAGKRARS